MCASARPCPVSLVPPGCRPHRVGRGVQQAARAPRLSCADDEAFGFWRPVPARQTHPGRSEPVRSWSFQSQGPWICRTLLVPPAASWVLVLVVILGAWVRCRLGAGRTRPGLMGPQRAACPQPGSSEQPPAPSPPRVLLALASPCGVTVRVRGDHCEVRFPSSFWMYNRCR